MNFKGTQVSSLVRLFGSKALTKGEADDCSTQCQSDGDRGDVVAPRPFGRVCVSGKAGDLQVELELARQKGEGGRR